VFRSLVLAWAAAVLAACAVIDPVDSRYDTISRSLAKARNEAILLNLVRASHNYPLDFVTIANVTPSMTNTTSLALPSFLVGPKLNGALPTTIDRDFLFGNTTASNSTAVSTNFSVSTQETSSFYEGFLSRLIWKLPIISFVKTILESCFSGYLSTLSRWILQEIELAHISIRQLTTAATHPMLIQGNDVFPILCY